MSLVLKILLSHLLRLHLSASVRTAVRRSALLVLWSVIQWSLYM